MPLGTDPPKTSRAARAPARPPRAPASAAAAPPGAAQTPDPAPIRPRRISSAHQKKRKGAHRPYLLS